MKREETDPGCSCPPVAVVASTRWPGPFAWQPRLCFACSVHAGLLQPSSRISLCSVELCRSRRQAASPQNGE